MERGRGKIQNKPEEETAVGVSGVSRRKMPSKKVLEKKSQQGTGIRCPNCGGQTRVVRSMPKPAESIHGRYRKCDACNSRMYTEEKIIYKIDKK